MAKPKRAKTTTDAAFSEVFNNPPGVVRRTKRRKGKKTARKQMIAIALDKAKRRGGKV